MTVIITNMTAVGSVTQTDRSWSSHTSVTSVSTVDTVNVSGHVTSHMSTLSEPGSINWHKLADKVSILTWKRWFYLFSVLTE